MPECAALADRGLSPGFSIYRCGCPAAGMYRHCRRQYVSRPAYFSDRIHSTSVLMSASLTCALGGIGTLPQTPEPP